MNKLEWIIQIDRVDTPGDPRLGMPPGTHWVWSAKLEGAAQPVTLTGSAGSSKRAEKAAARAARNFRWSEQNSPAIQSGHYQFKLPVQ